MRRGPAFLMAVLAALSIAPAFAQSGTYFETPAGNPNASCGGFQASMASGDGEIMRQLSGVWMAETPIPAQPGFFATTQQTRTTRYPNGALLYDEYRCFRPRSAAGAPPLPTSCATATGHGYWFARRPAADGWIGVGVLQEGSGFGGNHVGPNCTFIRARFLDANTIRNEFGVVGRRVGAVQ